MKTPFYHVITALSYIRGENMEDWVEAQDTLDNDNLDILILPPSLFTNATTLFPQ
jgi:hypothetical protein